jgi:hypothetical protein
LITIQEQLLKHAGVENLDLLEKKNYSSLLAAETDELPWATFMNPSAPYLALSELGWMDLAFCSGPTS